MEMYGDDRGNYLIHYSRTADADDHDHDHDRDDNDVDDDKTYSDRNYCTGG